MNPTQIQELIDLLSKTDHTSVISLWEALVALLLSLGCTSFIARVYRYTHRGESYSQSFAQTLVLVSLVTTLIMIVIGSNLARAFSLVGALSIIRFRNAVKETRDTGYVFFAMAVAMAMGTRFYGIGVMTTAFVSAVMVGFDWFDFGADSRAREHLLRVQLAPGADVEEVLGATLREHFSSYALVRVETTRQGMLQEAVLSVSPKPETTGSKAVDAIAKITELKVSYGYDLHRDDA
jgi:uncharacterized membrane protein YhiD involved in acid resistance